MGHLDQDWDDFDSYYVLKIKSEHGDKYFFTERMAVRDVGLAHQFNTLRSVKRIIKRCGLQNYKIEKRKRTNG